MEDLRIKSIVCREFNVRIEEVFKKTRKREVVDARRVYGYFMRKETKLSHALIAKPMGKDHSTNVHYVKTTKNLMASDRIFAKKVKNINETLNPPLVNRVDWGNITTQKLES